MVHQANSSETCSGRRPESVGTFGVQCTIVVRRSRERHTRENAGRAAVAEAMPPKKKAKLFDKVSDELDGVCYTLYEDGVLKVGTDSNRVTVRLKAGADIEAAVRKAAGLPERTSRLDKEVADLHLTAGSRPAAASQPGPSAEQQSSQLWPWQGLSTFCESANHCAVTLPNGVRHHIARDGCSCWRRELHYRAAHDEVAIVRSMLEAKADPNCEAHPFVRRTALHKAAIWGSDSAARVLLEHGASVEGPGDGWATPLHLASEPHRYGGSKRKIINLLLQHGASPTALTARRQQPYELVQYEDRALRAALQSPSQQQPLQTGAWWKAASGARYWLEPGQRLAFAPMLNTRVSVIRALAY